MKKLFSYVKGCLRNISCNDKYNMLTPTGMIPYNWK